MTQENGVRKRGSPARSSRASDYRRDRERAVVRAGFRLSPNNTRAREFASKSPSKRPNSFPDNPHADTRMHLQDDADVLADSAREERSVNARSSPKRRDSRAARDEPPSAASRRISRECRITLFTTSSGREDRSGRESRSPMRDPCLCSSGGNENGSMKALGLRPELLNRIDRFGLAAVSPICRFPFAFPRTSTSAIRRSISRLRGIFRRLACLPTNYEASGTVSLTACRHDDPDDTSMEYKVLSFFVSANDLPCDYDSLRVECVFKCMHV